MQTYSRGPEYLFVAGGCGQLLAARGKDGMKTPPEEAADKLRMICSVFTEPYGKQKV